MEDYEEYSNRAKQFTQIYAINNNAAIGNTQNKESYNNNSNVSFKNFILKNAIQMFLRVRSYMDLQFSMLFQQF